MFFILLPMKFRLLNVGLFFILQATSLPGFAQVEDSYDNLQPAEKISPGGKAKGNRENRPDSLNPSRSVHTKNLSDRTRTISVATDISTGKTNFPRPNGNNRIFGFSLFTNQDLTFEPSINIPTPKNYILGPTDDLIIDIWGASQATYRQKITPEGSILIPNLGPIYLSGMTIEEATGKITKELSAIFAGLRSGNSFIKVSLGSVRSIKVNLVGEISMPGTYTLSSLATVFNALYVANGPSENGSLRDVKVIRNNKPVAELDLYDFLLKGEQKDDIRLEDGDVVFIAPYQRRVDISGQIKRPGLFDMKSTESLKDLIYFAGGFTSKAYTQRIKIIRKTGKELKFLDIPTADQDTFRLSNGDEVKIDPILSTFENRVAIKGAVYRPGYFALDSTNTLKKLIRHAGGLKEEAFTNRILLFRLKDNFIPEVIPVDLSLLLPGNKDIFLQKDDSVFIPFFTDISEKDSVQIEGEVRKPGKFKYRSNMMAEDLIIQAGGFLESASFARMEIARRITNNMALTTGSQVVEIFQFPISKELKLADSVSKFLLKPFDMVFIRRSPGYGIQCLVSVEGEVLFPGKYSISRKKERISDLIQRAGNVTPEAYIRGASLMRKLSAADSLNRLQTLGRLLMAGDTSILIKDRSNNEISFEINPENIVNLKATLGAPQLSTGSKQQRLKLLGQLIMNGDTAIHFKNTGGNEMVLGINLDYILRHPGSDRDLYIQENDVIRIPRETQTITISGALVYPTVVPFIYGKRAKAYINRAGGFSENAKTSKTYVIHANGSVSKTSRGWFFSNKYPRVEPGATIVVPEKNKMP